MKIFIKSIFLVLVSCLIIYFMARNNFLHIESLKSAFIIHRKLIFIILILQIILCFVTTLRYFSLLNLFQIKVDFKNVTAATFVSNALGLWMPGSMAFIEIIRISLMIGAEHKLHSDEAAQLYKETEEKEKKNKTQLSLRSRLTTASLFDRLIGLWSMLIIGLFFIGWTLLHHLNEIIHTNSYEYIGLICMFIFTLSLFIFITFLPYFSSKLIIRKTLNHIERFFLRLFRRSFFNRFLKKLVFEINSILDAISHGGKQFNKFLIPILYSFLCVFIQAFAIYYAAMAISSIIPFSAILATISILALATILPIGFGGVGGVQIIAAIALSFFGVSPQIAASAQLLQTAINIVAISFAGLFFLQLTSKQVKSILNLYKLKKRN